MLGSSRDPNERLHRISPEGAYVHGRSRRGKRAAGVCPRSYMRRPAPPRLPASRHPTIEPLATSLESGTPSASVGFRASRLTQRTPSWPVPTLETATEVRLVR